MKPGNQKLEDAKPETKQLTLSQRLLKKFLQDLKKSLQKLAEEGYPEPSHLYSPQIYHSKPRKRKAKRKGK